jgi:integrase/recombinase XerD
MVYDREGERKYLTASEREVFLLHAARTREDHALFCQTLAHTGCRLSEALQLNGRHLDPENQAVIIRCLKKRNSLVYRSVPLPSKLIQALDCYRSRDGKTSDSRLWPWSRTKGWMVVRSVMRDARLDGPYASPKGLRHSFAITALQSGVPINLVQKWMGHSRIETTAIYANAIGPEERGFAELLWASRSSANSGLEQSCLAIQKPI